MDCKNSGQNLVGHRLDQYCLEELLNVTAKSLIFKGRHATLGRVDLIKVLKPSQELNRQEQFLEEGKRLVGLERKDNLPIVHYASESQGHKYIAMELLESDEGNLFDLVHSKKPLKLDELVNIMIDSVNGVTNLHDAGLVHGDIKLKNLIRMQKTTYLIDLGGRVSSAGDYPGDISALGNCFLTLSNYCTDEVPEKLRRIVEKTKNPEKYSHIEQLKKELEKFRRNRDIKRKIFKTGIASLLFSAVLGSGTIIINEYHEKQEYHNSIQFIVDQIRSSQSTNLEALSEELETRIFHQKIKEVNKRIPKDKFPFGTIQDGTWYCSASADSSNGYWAGILWTAYEKTKDPEFKKLAEERTDAINLDEGDSSHTIAVRHFYSAAKAYDLTKNEDYKIKAIAGLELLVNKFDQETKLISIETGKPVSEAGMMVDVVPYLWWGYDLTKKEIYRKIAIAQTNSTIDFNIREDGSVRKTAIFNPTTRELIDERNSKGYDDSSTLSRTQAQMLVGLIETYRNTQDKKILDAAIKTADYFIDHLPQDRVPYYDFDAPIDEETKKDSAAAAIASYALKILANLSEIERYDKESQKIKESLIKEYLSYDVNEYEGLLMHACENMKRKRYTDCSLILGEYYFIKN